TGVVHAVPHPFRVDDELRAAPQRDAHLAITVVLRGAQDHHAVGVVGELQPRPHDAPRAVRVQAVVVVEVDPALDVGHDVRLELDDAHAPEVGADTRRPLHQRRAPGRVLGPDAALVRFAVVPEPGALD